jgi:hypothetical protein
MVLLPISETLAEKISRRANAEQVSVEDLLNQLVDEPVSADDSLDEYGNTAADRAVLDSLIGFIDSDLTDLSTTTSEARDRFYQERFAHVDSD